MLDCLKAHLTCYLCVGFIAGGTFHFGVCSDMPNDIFVSLTSRVALLPGGIICPPFKVFCLHS